MNQHTIIGNLARDPETGNTQSGVNWCTFTVAVNRRGQNQDAIFVRVTAWRALADTCGKYLKKGRKVCVVGESDAHGWIGQNGEARAQIELTAREVEFLSSGQGQSGERTPTDADVPGGAGSGAAAAGEGAADGRTQGGSGPPAAGPANMMPVEDPDDLPF